MIRKKVEISFSANFEPTLISPLQTCQPVGGGETDYQQNDL